MRLAAKERQERLSGTFRNPGCEGARSRLRRLAAKVYNMSIDAKALSSVIQWGKLEGERRCIDGDMARHRKSKIWPAF